MQSLILYSCPPFPRHPDRDSCMISLHWEILRITLTHPEPVSSSIASARSRTPHSSQWSTATTNVDVSASILYSRTRIHYRIQKLAVAAHAQLNDRPQVETLLSPRAIQRYFCLLDTHCSSITTSLRTRKVTTVYIDINSV